jgi:hypothetical protein
LIDGKTVTIKGGPDDGATRWIANCTDRIAIGKSRYQRDRKNSHIFNHLFTQVKHGRPSDDQAPEEVASISVPSAQEESTQ